MKEKFDINRIRFAYGDTVSVAWMPVGMSTKVAFTVRSEKDRHEKNVARNNLINRLADPGIDNQFVFYIREAYCRREENPNPNLLKYETVLNACISPKIMGLGVAKIAKQFAYEVAKPGDRLTDLWFEVYQQEAKKAEPVQRATYDDAQKTYKRGNLELKFYHNVDAKWSIGWTLRNDEIWFAVAAAHPTDKFVKETARSVIMKKRGVLFRINKPEYVKFGYRDSLRCIAACVRNYAHGHVSHPDAEELLGKLPKDVVQSIILTLG